MKNLRLITLLVLVLFTIVTNAQKKGMGREMGNGRRGMGGPVVKINYDSLLTAFKPVADDYQLLTEKPTMTEEQRKFIVQANSWNEQMDYNKAIGLYNQAVDLNPISYPTAYLNLALLCAQTNRYEAAIYHMKKYLMLVPDAEDARSAQDKIYEWEAKLGR